ncbi:unnamed protein product, partial [Gulo gulo]
KCRPGGTAGTRASAPRSVHLESAVFPTTSSTCPGVSSPSPWKIAIIRRNPFREPTRLSGCLEMKTCHRVSCLQSSWVSLICFLSWFNRQFLQIKKTLKI